MASTRCVLTQINQLLSGKVELRVSFSSNCGSARGNWLYVSVVLPFLTQKRSAWKLKLKRLTELIF